MQLPLQQQHRLVMILVSWLSNQQHQQLPPHATRLLLELATCQRPGCGGVRAAAQLVLSVLQARSPPGSTGACSQVPCMEQLAPAPMPLWLQQQSLLLAQATSSWGEAGTPAVSSDDQPAEGSPCAETADMVASSPKRELNTAHALVPLCNARQHA